MNAIKLVVLWTFLWISEVSFAQVAIFTNNNPMITIVPYGGTFTYSVSYYCSNITTVGGVVIRSYYNNQLASYSDLPNTYTINYTITNIRSSDVGYYYIAVSGPGLTGYQFSPEIYLYESPVIQKQPSDTVCVSGSSTTMGLVGGPITSINGDATSFQWFEASTGNPLSDSWDSPTFTPIPANNGEIVYCKITNPFGSVTSSNVLLSVGSGPSITSQPQNVSAIM
jgi:hypothetical protein